LKLKPWQLSHSLLNILTSDFYRRPGSIELFGKLFPEQHFDPNNSVSRLYVAINHINDIFSRSGTSARILSVDGGYTLTSKESISFRLDLERKRKNPLMHFIGRIAEANLPPLFSVSEASRSLGIHPRTAGRLLRSACDKKLIKRHGQARSTKYQIHLEKKD
jgi:hypothetical protein